MFEAMEKYRLRMYESPIYPRLNLSSLPDFMLKKRKLYKNVIVSTMRKNTIVIQSARKLYIIMNYNRILRKVH